LRQFSLYADEFLHLKQSDLCFHRLNLFARCFNAQGLLFGRVTNHDLFSASLRKRWTTPIWWECRAKQASSRQGLQAIALLLLKYLTQKLPVLRALSQIMSCSALP